MFKDLDDFQVCFQSSGILTWSSVGSEKLKPFKTHNFYSKRHRGRVKIKFSVVENVFTCRKWSRYLEVDILNLYVSLLYIKYSFFQSTKMYLTMGNSQHNDKSGDEGEFHSCGWGRPTWRKWKNQSESSQQITIKQSGGEVCDDVRNMSKSRRKAECSSQRTHLNSWGSLT